MLRLLLALTLVPAAALLAWMALSDRQERADFVVASDQVRTIDPHRVSWSDEILIASALFEGLARLDPASMKPVPAAAEHWSCAVDGRTYTFHLRPEARWSDGSPLLAEHFRSGWLRVLDPETESQYASLLFVIDGAQAYYRSRLNHAPEDDAPADSIGVTAADDRTLFVRLAAPCAYFLDLASFPTFAPLHPAMQTPAADRGAEAAPWIRPQRIVTNGAYTLERWDFKHRQVLRRNPHYWDAPRVHFDSIEIFFTASPAAALLAYETQRVDFVRALEPETIAVLLRQQEQGRRNDVHVGDRFATYFFRVNCRRPPLDNADLRKALSLAIDREDLCRHVTGLGETPAYAYVPRGALELLARTAPDGQPVHYRPSAGLGEGLSRDKRLALAREHVARSGFLRHAASRPIELSFAAEPVQQRRIAEAVQAMWERNLGLRVELRVNERNVLSTRIRELDYDVARSDWYGDYPDPSTFLDMFHGDSGQNRTGWQNDEYDRLIEAAAAEGDVEQRYELLRAAEQILCVEQLPIIPLYFKRGNYLLRPSIAGIYDNVRDFFPIQRAERSPSTEPQ
ncbi:MAG: peptide ABC transporter substrate-binding protein [Phycisphaerae bacterium]|jgi:oligopeptide transport system substrate-binding protein